MSNIFDFKPVRFFFKGIIHITDQFEVCASSDKRGKFECIDYSFFTTDITLDGMFLTNTDYQLDFAEELTNEHWRFVPKLDGYYSVLWEFTAVTTETWTDDGYEYDFEITTANLNFKELDTKEVEELFKESKDIHVGG